MASVRTLIATLISSFCLLVASPLAKGQEFVVYSVYRALDLGNSDEASLKDYYVNMGSKDGVSKGAVLEVRRRTATYDLINQKLYKDVAFPIATLRVIHVESSAAIARLEKMTPPEKTPAISPRTIMVGDIVQLAR